MKLTEVLCFVFVLSLLSPYFYREEKVYFSLVRRRTDIQKNYHGNLFIAEGFKKMCQEKKISESDLDSFARTCQSLWNPEKLCIRTEGIKDRKRLIRCSWEFEGQRRECLRIVSEES